MTDFFFSSKKTPSFKKNKLNKQKSRHKNVFFLKSNNYNTLERVMKEAFHAVNKSK